MLAKLIFFVVLATTLNISPATGSDLRPAKNFAQPNLRISRSANKNDPLKDLLVFIIETQGVPWEKIRSQILESADNLEDTIAIIDEAFGENVIVIDGDLVKIDFVNFRKILYKFVHVFSRQNFATNPMMGIVFEFTVKERIRQGSLELQELLEKKTIPVNVARAALVMLSPVLQRRKRDVDSIAQAGLMEDLMFGFIRQQIAAIVYPIRVSINDTFNGLIDNVLDFYVGEAPTDDIGLVLDFTKNLAVRRLVDTLTMARITVDEIFTDLVGSAASLRQRRDVSRQEREVATQPGEVEAVQLLDFILYPIQLILEMFTNPLGAILGITLSGLNNWLKDSIIKLLESIYPTVGYLVVSPLRKLLWSVIDLVLPCNGC